MRFGSSKSSALPTDDPGLRAGEAVRTVYIPGKDEPITIPRRSESLYLLQRLRDESHRFAIGYQRQLRKKRMTKSVLDDIAGLGPTRKKRLVKEMGG